MNGAHPKRGEVAPGHKLPLDSSMTLLLEDLRCGALINARRLRELKGGAIGATATWLNDVQTMIATLLDASYSEIAHCVGAGSVNAKMDKRSKNHDRAGWSGEELGQVRNPTSAEIHEHRPELCPVYAGAIQAKKNAAAAYVAGKRKRSRKRVKR